MKLDVWGKRNNKRDRDDDAILSKTLALYGQT
jgi:hypothetical protein